MRSARHELDSQANRILTRSRRFMVGSALIVVVVDALTKGLAASHGTVHRNPGMSFGLLADTPWLATIVSTLALIAVGWAAWRWVRNTADALGWGLILGGAVGNALDRYVQTSSSGVVDWISIPGYPAYFNIADVAIRLGAVIVIARLSWSAFRRPAVIRSEQLVTTDRE